MPAAKRLYAELEPVVGCLIQMVPVRVQVGPSTSFRELLREVRRVSTETLERPPFRPSDAEGQELNALLSRVLFSYVDVPEIDPRWSLKVLEAENAKLKKILTEQMMDVAAPKEMLGKTSEARFEKESRGLGHDREELLAAARLCAGGDRSACLSAQVEEA